MKPDLVRVLLLWAFWIVVSLGSYFILAALLPSDPAAPESETRWLSLWIVVIMSVLVAGGVTAARWWGAIGYTPIGRWRELGWLAVPAVLALLPLVGGIKSQDASAYAVFIPGFLLTGFVEETMFRGVLVKLLGKRPPWQIALITAVLFGLVHLSNIVIRGQVGIIAAQAVGAACFGFGFAALRLRTNTVLPLVLLHAMHDILLWMGNVPLIPMSVAQDLVLLALGLWLLRGWQRPAGDTL